jgi:hypothetical protein
MKGADEIMFLEALLVFPNPSLDEGVKGAFAAAE